LEPAYQSAAGKSNIPLAKVDATIETQLGKKYAMQGYPTLKFWQEGK
jgi:hypothetical protein